MGLKRKLTILSLISKEENLALEISCKYFEGNESMGNLFKPLGCLENTTENNILNKQKKN